MEMETERFDPGLITDAALDLAFASAADHGQLWLAFIELMNRQVHDRVMEVASPSLCSDVRAFRSGALNNALEFRNDIFQRMRSIKERAIT